MDMLSMGSRRDDRFVQARRGQLGFFYTVLVHASCSHVAWLYSKVNSLTRSLFLIISGSRKAYRDM